MTVLLEGNTDAQKSGTRSIKRVYQKMKNKNKPDNTSKRKCFQKGKTNITRKKCKFNDVNKTNSLKSLNFKIKGLLI